MKQSALQLADEYKVPTAFAFDEQTAKAKILEAVNEKTAGPEHPHRVRVLLSSNGQLDVQVSLEAKDTSAISLVLDQKPTCCSDSVFVRCKTTFRPMYTEATARLSAEHSGAQVLLFNAQGEITEGNVANVAVGMPDGSGEMQLVTPPVSAGLLAGTMRASLLECGRIVEGRITVDQFKHAVKRGWPVMCMNSVRGLYKVTPIVTEYSDKRAK
ncbi:hypothetical protein IWW38_003287 [Coemansia aciculifera]|uniref:Uncharacterized protein n=1 Tax=Coemansia aciculifera TaxID=417176 RepID=A0ACC1M0U4_9FUNG|nr:hypothetical protein IWW38_003287 [Coemansia aciculifera]